MALLLDAESSLVDGSGPLIRAARAAGVPVALSRSSGATGDVDAAGDGEFDVVGPPGGPGAQRPSRTYFENACLALNVAPARCLYVGAEERDVRGARAAGLSAYRWNGPQDLAYLHAALGLPV
jgi:putative hydrolase of the HAD superfamily